MNDTMRIGIDRLAEDLLAPELGTNAPGAYDGVIANLGAVADHPEFLAPLQAAWSDRTFTRGVARPFLLLAALRDCALRSNDHPLAIELRMDASAPNLKARILEAMADPNLIPLLRDRDIVRHEAARAASWGLPALLLTLPHRGFDILDIGTGAGLSLVVDRTAIPFRFGMTRLTGVDLPSPEGRYGLDRSPIDLRNDDDARWFEACIWPAQLDRLQRYKETRDLWRRPWIGQAPQPELHPFTIGEDALGDVIDRIYAARPLIITQNVVEAELDEATTAHLHAERDTILRRHRDILWASLEPHGQRYSLTPLQLTISLHRADRIETIPLAQTGYHSDQSILTPRGSRALKEAWVAP